MELGQFSIFVLLLLIMSTFWSEADEVTEARVSKPTGYTRKFRQDSKNQLRRDNDERNLKDLNEIMNFDVWSKKYNKTYNNYIKPQAEAREAFEQNSGSIRAHNSQPNVTYTRNLQSHSDLTYEEKKMYRMGFIGGIEDDVDMIVLSINRTKGLRRKVNYTEWFPPVRDQGLCGSCYAFSSVSILEYMSRKNGDNETYSEQNILDCSTGNQGCDGGWPGNAMRYVRDQGVSNGLVYTYEGGNSTCRRYLYPPILTIEEVCTYSLRGDEKKLQALIDEGPVVGAIATTDGFTSYSRGVFYDEGCSSTDLEHAITIVGYGTEKKGGDYWLIRNSWGSDWGINGYGMMARNRNNHCGIALYAIIPCSYA